MKRGRTECPIPADFLQNANLSSLECARIFGVSGGTIRKWKRKLGVVSLPRGGGWRRGQRSTVVPADFLEKTKHSNVTDLATHYGVSISTISKWRDISGLTLKHGDLQAFRKKYAAIVADANSSVSLEAIAVKHNVSREWVRQILMKAGHPMVTNAVLSAALAEAMIEIKRLREQIELAGTRGVG